MKLFILIIVFLSVAIPASAVDLVCTLPAGNVSRSSALCEELRINMRVRLSEWSNNVCATQFLRIGLVTGERQSSTKAANVVVETMVEDAINVYLSTWAALTSAVCGDGITDTEIPFEEECDDGNEDNGDGCDSECIIEP